MTNLVTRAGKGTALSAADHDNNLDHLSRILYDSPKAFLDTTRDFPEGSIVRAGGFTYVRAADAAEDHHVTTAGDRKFYLRNDGHISPKCFGAIGDNSSDDTDALKAAIAYVADSNSSARGCKLIIDGFFRVGDTLEIPRRGSSGFRIEGTSAGANSNNETGGIISWEYAPDNLRAGITTRAANVHITNVGLMGAGRLRRIIELRDAQGFRLRDCAVRGAKNNDYAMPGTCIWGFGQINSIIDGCTIGHGGYSRGIDVQSSNGTEFGFTTGQIYYGFDNGSIISGCRFFGNMASAIIDGGNFTFQNSDISGALLIDSGKVVVVGQSTNLIFQGNYFEVHQDQQIKTFGYFDSTTNPGGLNPMVCLNIPGGNNVNIFGNTFYTKPDREPGSVAISATGNYRRLLVMGNSIGRFETGIRGNGQNGATDVLIQSNNFFHVNRAISTSGNLNIDASAVNLSVVRPYDLSLMTSSSNGRQGIWHSRHVKRRQGQTQSEVWSNQIHPTIDFRAGNMIRYHGEAGNTLTYGTSIQSLTLSSGGAGYTSAPDVTIDPPDVTALQAQARAEIRQENRVDGVAASVEFQDRGWNYTSTPRVTVSGGGATEDAVVVATLASRDFPSWLRGAVYYLDNSSGGQVSLATGNGRGGTFRPSAGIPNPITLQRGEVAEIVVRADGDAVVTAISGGQAMAPIADASSEADAVTKLNALLAALRAKGHLLT
jgi:hypothetical protein